MCMDKFQRHLSLNKNMFYYKAKLWKRVITFERKQRGRATLCQSFNYQLIITAVPGPSDQHWTAAPVKGEHTSC